jgi:hypothetical protein
MHKSLGTVILVLLLGVLIGALCSELIGLFLPAGGIWHRLFVAYVPFGFEPPVRLNLIVLDLTLGLQIHFNLMSIIGVFLASQILRWYR